MARPSKVISLSLDPELLAAVDASRAAVPRSVWIAEAMRARLEGAPSTSAARARAARLPPEPPAKNHRPSGLPPLSSTWRR